MKINKKMLIMLLVFMVVSSICATAFAGNPALSLKDSLAGASGDGSVNYSFTSIMAAIITVARVIAVGVAIVMILVLAMKYMMAAPGDKAEIKKSAVIYVVGAVVLFAVGGILTIIQKFASNIS